MAVLINFFNKAFALILSAFIMFTGSINSFFSGDVYEFESVSTVVGLETLTRSQGVTNDGVSFIFSGKNYLERTSLACTEVLAINTDAIPQELKDTYSSAHIGGISYFNGYIYAAVEDSKIWKHPLIVLYDAQTLAYTGKYYELPAENHTRGVPWVTVDGEHGIVYAGNSSDSDKIFMYDINTFSYLGALTFSEPVAKIQGGEYSDGCLYFGTNDITRSVWKVNVSDGKAEKLFSRINYEYKYIDNFGGEGEGLTVLQMSDGTFIHTLQLGASFTDATLRHYKWDK